VFWLDVPLVLLMVVAAARVVPAAAGRADGRLDLAGLAALVVTLGGLVFTIIEAGRGAAPLAVAVAPVVTVLAAGSAYRFERSAPHPVLPLDLLRRPASLSPNTVALVMNLTFNGLLFLSRCSTWRTCWAGHQRRPACPCRPSRCRWCCWHRCPGG
jgi:DHA2 family methylenomycin A resistance protein-like MFS transporter